MRDSLPFLAFTDAWGPQTKSRLFNFFQVEVGQYVHVGRVAAASVNASRQVRIWAEL